MDITLPSGISGNPKAVKNTKNATAEYFPDKENPGCSFVLYLYVYIYIYI